LHKIIYIIAYRYLCHIDKLHKIIDIDADRFLCCLQISCKRLFYIYR